MSTQLSRRDLVVGAMSVAMLPACARTQCSQGSSSALATRLGRGVAIHAAYNWPVMTPGGDYVWPPFADAASLLADSHLVALRRAGVNFIRLTVNPRIFIAHFSNTDRYAEAQGILGQGLAQLFAHGFNVIVDLHSISRDPENRTDALVTPLGNINAVHVGELIERFAKWLSKAPSGRVALELWNEPDVTDANAGAWDELQQEWHRRARKSAPGLTLVVGGTHTNDPGLIRLDGCSYNDGNTYFAFHFYDPTPFTLQGMPLAPHSVDPLQFFQQIRYPASSDDVGEAVIAARQRLAARPDFPSNVRAAADHYITSRARYLNRRDNQGWIAERFANVAAWAVRNGISADRVLLGEFGVMRPKVDTASRLRWLADVRREAEVHGFPWSLWLYERPDNMGLVVDSKTFALDPAMLKALGLNPA